jgi:CBS domain-containing protein
MSRVFDLVADRRLHSISADANVFEAARLMADQRIGALPVLRDGELLGIISERDVLTRVVAQGRSPGATKVSEVMTANPRTVSIDESAQTCLFIMRELGFRHLPICEGKQLKAMISLRDITFHFLDLKKKEVA